MVSKIFNFNIFSVCLFFYLLCTCTLVENLSTHQCSEKWQEITNKRDEERYNNQKIYSFTPLEKELFKAVREGNIENVKILLEKGAYNDKSNPAFNYNTPLLEAVWNNHVEIGKLLNKKGADPTKESGINHVSPMEIAIAHNYIEIVIAFLENGVDPNTIEEGDPCHSESYLSRATEDGYIQIVQVLLKYEADPNVTAKNNNWTPLHAAAKEGYIEIVKILLEAGAHKSMNVKSLQYLKGSVIGYTPLDWAKAEGHKEVATILENFKS